jgi:hypothetical protein
MCWPTGRSPAAPAPRSPWCPLDPFVAEIGSATWDRHRSFTWAGGARRFATWEHSYINVLGLGAAVRQALDLGLNATGQRAAAPGTRLRDQLGELPGVTTHDLGQTRCAIVTAKIHGCQLNRQPGNWAAPEPTSPPPSLATIRSTPKTGTSTRASDSPRATTPRLSRSGARLTWRSAGAESDRPVAAMLVAGGDGPAYGRQVRLSTWCTSRQGTPSAAWRRRMASSSGGPGLGRP